MIGTSRSSIHCGAVAFDCAQTTTLKKSANGAEKMNPTSDFAVNIVLAGIGREHMIHRDFPSIVMEEADGNVMPANKSANYNTR